MAAARGTSCARMEVAKHHQCGRRSMQVTTVGLDVAKNVFQAHGVDHRGRVVLRRRLRRAAVLASPTNWRGSSG
jgi:hypothetical protein